MLQVSDLRHTKVFQEALAEGMEKGREEASVAVARRLLEDKFPLKKIAGLTGLSVAKIKSLQKNQEK